MLDDEGGGETGFGIGLLLLVTVAAPFPRRDLPGIEPRGLLCGESLGKLKIVWLHAPGKTAWALLHTVRDRANTRLRFFGEVPGPRGVFVRSAAVRRWAGRPA